MPEKTERPSSPVPPPTGHKKPALIPVLSMYAVIAVILLSGLGVIVGKALNTIGDLAENTRDSVLPEIFDRQRTAINLERLGRFALIIHKADDPKKRRAFRLAAKILSQDTAFDANPEIRSKVSRCYEAMERIAIIRGRQDVLQKRLDEDESLLRENLASLQPCSPKASARQRAMNRAERVLLIQLLHVLSSNSHQRLEQTVKTVNELSNKVDTARLDVRLARNGTTISQSAIIDTKRRILNMDMACNKTWDEVNRDLETLSASLTANAAIEASQRFTTIADEASAGLNGGLTGLIIAISTMILMLVLVRRDVLTPISKTVQAMARARDSHAPIDLPEARLREMHEIQTSVELSSTLMAEITHRTQELEQTNAALEKEIAERIRTERELGRAKEAAESADKAKSDFLAGMSHEIRTPMNTILGMAELMLETDPTPEQRKYIEIFKTSGHHLLGIINDVLDISKIEAGQLCLETHDTTLSDVLDKIHLLYRTKADDKGLSLKVVVGEGTPKRIMADPIRIGQILTNLVDNAIKFTHQGGVSIEAHPAPSGIEGEIVFSVSDTGIGIPPEAQRRVFDRFTQADSSTTRQYGGTGLGLSISRRLVEIMGGTLRLNSSPKRGTIFSFTLRFPLPEQAPESGPEATREEVRHLTDMLRQRPVSILLAEDSDSNRELLKFYLAHAGCEIDFAENGLEAVNKFKEKTYDVVLMDIQMPVMDGFEATRLLREHERQTGMQPTPIIAVTANALSEDRGRCIEAGCTFYLAKPVSKATLLKTLASTVGIV